MNMKSAFSVSVALAVVISLPGGAYAQRPSLAGLQEQVDELQEQVDELYNATDGVILINQEKALAGNVTAGDNPGFPVSISRPGGYRLSGNLTVSEDTPAAIGIQAEGVTIDLNGFTITSSTGRDSIGILGNRHVTVKNGTIRGLLFGIRLGDGSHIEHVKLIENFFASVQVGAGSIVSNCVVQSYGTDGGISVEEGSIVSGNTVMDDDGNLNGSGIFALGSLVENNSVRKSLIGITAGFGGSAISNTLHENSIGISFGQIGSKTAFSGNSITESQISVQGTQFVDLGNNLCGDDLVCP